MPVAKSALPFPTTIPAIAAPAAKAPIAKQLAAFEQAVDIGPLAWTDALANGFDKSAIERGDRLLNTRPLFDEITARVGLVEILVQRLVERADNAEVARALTRVVVEHPCPRLRMAVADAVVVASAPKPALDAVATWIELPATYDHWTWMCGAQAVLASRPAAKAFDLLAPYLADEQYAERVFGALQQFEGDLDPRFFDAAARWMFTSPGKPDAQYFFKIHGDRPEVQAILVRATEKLAAGKAEPKWGYFYMMLRAIKVRGALPALVKIAARAAKHGDWRFTSPLSAIEELADPTALPELHALAETAKGKTRAAILAVIASLEKHAPKAAKAKATRATKATKATKDPNSIAGLSAERAASIVALSRNRIDLAPKRAAKPPLGATRFGGDPDLPANMPWPHIECDQIDLNEKPDPALAIGKKGRYRLPLAFVAQLDLAALAKHDEDHLLPATGMLWLFARQTVVVGERRDLVEIASHVVYVARTPKLVRTSPPGSLPEHERYDAAIVAISHTRPLPPPNVEPIRELALITSEARAYEVATAKARHATHASLGWANAGYFLGIPAAAEQLLLRVGSDAASGFEWGDAGSIFFSIPTAALAKRDFAKTYCTMDE